MHLLRQTESTKTVYYRMLGDLYYYDIFGKCAQIYDIIYCYTINHPPHLYISILAVLPHYELQNKCHQKYLSYTSILATTTIFEQNSAMWQCDVLSARR